MESDSSIYAVSLCIWNGYILCTYTNIHSRVIRMNYVGIRVTGKFTAT